MTTRTAPPDTRGMPPPARGIPGRAWVALLHIVEEHLRRSPAGQITTPGDPACWPTGINSHVNYISSTHYAAADGSWRVRRDTVRTAVYAWRDAHPEGAAARDEYAATHQYARQWESNAANERRRINDPTHPAHNPGLRRDDLEMYERYRDLALHEAAEARRRAANCPTQLTLGL